MARILPAPGNQLKPVMGIPVSHPSRPLVLEGNDLVLLFRLAEAPTDDGNRDPAVVVRAHHTEQPSAHGRLVGFSIGILSDTSFGRFVGNRPLSEETEA